MAPTAGRPAFVLTISAWLWLTVLFANFAEAVAEGRGKAQAAALRATRKEVQAKKLNSRARRTATTLVQASSLRRDDIVLVEAARRHPRGRRGHRRRGVGGRKRHHRRIGTSLRESGGDFGSVTGGTRVFSDWLVVRVTSNPGEALPGPDDRDGGRRQARQDAE